jgi:peptidyl-prolyl cis-trans isomerase D
MLRRCAVLVIFALAGCSGLRDALTAHQDVVARAAGQQLTATQLAQLIAPVKQIPMHREIVDRLADIWVDYQLLGQAAARGDSLMDSTTVAEANWPAVMQRLVDHYHDSTIMQRAKVSDRQVDSAYNTGNLRWLDHILVRVAQDTTAELKAARRRVAEGYLAQLRGGANFGRLASQKSEDPGSAKSGGSLGLVTRGTLVKAFEDAAWGLKPGEYSGTVQTPWGYHIIWRPTLEQVRDSYAVGLRGVMVQRLDSLYADSVTRETGIKVKSSAAAAARSAAQNMRDAKTSGRVLASYRGGKLTVRTFVRWLEAFPPQTRQAVAQAPDSTLVQFIQTVVRNEMMIQAAKARHIGLSATDRDTIRHLFRDDVATMEARLGVAPESLAADTAARRSRSDAAAHRVDQYFAGLVSSPAAHAFFEVPPFLADLLRDRSSWSISPAGVDRALEKARELRGPETSPGMQAPGTMTPAPTGPPMGQPQPGQTQPPAAPTPSKRGR